MDPALPGSLLAGLGSSLVDGGIAQKNISRSIAAKYTETLENQTRTNNKKEIKELANITLKKKLKPLDSDKIGKKNDHYENILVKNLKTVNGLL